MLVTTYFNNNLLKDKNILKNWKIKKDEYDSMFDIYH